jgi:hypothetical protein
MLSGGGRGRVRRLLRVVWKVHEARGSWVVDQSLLVVLLIVSVSLKTLQRPKLTCIAAQ